MQLTTENLIGIFVFMFLGQTFDIVLYLYKMAGIRRQLKQQENRNNNLAERHINLMGEVYILKCQMDEVVTLQGNESARRRIINAGSSSQPAPPPIPESKWEPYNKNPYPKGNPGPPPPIPEGRTIKEGTVPKDPKGYTSGW